jgi:hypothetical protein
MPRQIPQTPAPSDWLLLITTLPTKNATARMRLWRAIKSHGCATLRDGAYLLPAQARTEHALARLAADTQEAGGSAHLLQMTSRDAAQEAVFRALFDRSVDYRALLDAIDACPKREAAALKALKGLRRDFETIAATDYFPGEARRQAEDALKACEAAASGEPGSVAGRIRRLAQTDFSGRTWATRKHLWVDRMASAWLIRRFIDRKAKFLWLDDPRDCPPDALGFDFDGATFTHVAGTPERVTFETLAASFGLETDPALARIATIVHCLDVGGVPVAEAAGIEAVLAGLRADAGDDDKLLKEAGRIFDGLYNNYRQENPND